MKGMDLNKLMQQAAQMQEQVQKMQQEAANETAEASVGGGMVKAEWFKRYGANERPERFDVVYNMLSLSLNQRLRVIVTRAREQLEPLAGRIEELVEDQRPVDRQGVRVGRRLRRRDATRLRA